MDLIAVIEHAALALPFVGLGWFLRGMCHHIWDRVLVGGVMLFAEAAIMVTVLPH